MAMKTFKEYLNPIPLEEHLSIETKRQTSLLVDAVYSQYAQSGTMGPEVVGWLDGEQNAVKRNEIIYEAGIGKNDSVLDVGCGVCHFYDYLKEQGWECEYLGIDPNQKALDLVREEIDTKCGIIEDLNGDTEMLSWDWVIASGIFNIGLKENHMKWTMNDMISKSNKGVVVNYLKFPYENEQYEAYAPHDIQDWLTENYSPKKIEVRENYLVTGNTDAEFTIYFYV